MNYDKRLSIWEQLVARKAEYIGGVIEDQGDDIDRRLGAKPARTRIKDITLTANGTEGRYFFNVRGNSFGCGFDTTVGGIGGGSMEDVAEGWLTLMGYGGHIFRIKGPKKAEVPA